MGKYTGEIIATTIILAVFFIAILYLIATGGISG